MPAASPGGTATCGSLAEVAQRAEALVSGGVDLGGHGNLHRGTQRQRRGSHRRASVPTRLAQDVGEQLAGAVRDLRVLGEPRGAWRRRRSTWAMPLSRPNPPSAARRADSAWSAPRRAPSAASSTDTSAPNEPGVLERAVDHRDLPGDVGDRSDDLHRDVRRDGRRGRRQFQPKLSEPFLDERVVHEDIVPAVSKRRQGGLDPSRIGGPPTRAQEARSKTERYPRRSRSQTASRVRSRSTARRSISFSPPQMPCVSRTSKSVLEALRADGATNADAPWRPPHGRSSGFASRSSSARRRT